MMPLFLSTPKIICGQHRYDLSLKLKSPDAIRKVVWKFWNSFALEYFLDRILEMKFNKKSEELQFETIEATLFELRGSYVKIIGLYRLIRTITNVYGIFSQPWKIYCIFFCLTLWTARWLVECYTNTPKLPDRTSDLFIQQHGNTRAAHAVSRCAVRCS